MIPAYLILRIIYVGNLIFRKKKDEKIIQILIVFFKRTTKTIYYF